MLTPKTIFIECISAGVAPREANFALDLSGGEVTNMKRTLALFAGLLAIGTVACAVPPSVVPDAYSLDEDVPLRILTGNGVLSNDVDNGNTPLQSFVGSDPEHGRLIMDWNGGFRFYPDTNYFGADSFSYFARKALVFNVVTNAGKSQVVIMATIRVNQPPLDPFYPTNQTQTSTAKMNGYIVGNLLPWATSGPFTSFQTLGFDITNTTQNAFTFQFYTTYFGFPLLVAENIITVPPGGLRMSLFEPPAPAPIIAGKFDQTNVLTSFDVKGRARDRARETSGEWGDWSETSVNLGGTVLPIDFTNTTLIATGSTNTLKMLVGFSVTNVLVDEATMTFADVVATGIIEAAAAAIDNVGETSAMTSVSLTINSVDDAPVGSRDSYVSLQAATLTPASSAMTNAESLISPGSSWSYLYTNVAPSSNWATWAYDETSWRTGAAAIGFGSNIVTDMRAGGISNIATAYFRRDFYVEDLSDSMSEVLLSLRRDDAAAIYVNGAQVYRDANLLSNATHATFVTASPITGALQNTFISIPFSASRLFEGWNVLAAEVHNYKSGAQPPDADMCFDCGLSRTRGAAGVLNNDYDVDTPTSNLNAVVFVPPQRGSLSLNPDGSFIYAPESGFTGSVSFAYKVLDRAPPGDVPQVLVPTNGTWRMLADGSNPSSQWKTNTFVDTTWKKGLAEIGYMDEMDGRPEITNIRTDSNLVVYATYYFRQGFLSSLDTLFVTNLVGRILRDDAAAVYLNGIEVYRDTNLAAGATYTTLATSETPSETEFAAFTISPSLLMQGSNMVAVEVHQASLLKSEDLSFDFELIANVNSGAHVTINVLPDDADGDLVSDTYERRYGYNYADPSDAGVDDDLDGRNLRMEFIGDTNPRDGASYLYSASTTIQGTNAVLRFNGISTDRMYQLQSTTNLTQWADVGAPIAGSSLGDTLNVPLVPGEPRRFYRLQAVHIFP